ELYNQLDPILTPQLKKVIDAQEALLWNPESKEINVALRPDKLALYGILPGDVYRSLDASLGSLTGGEVRLGQETAHLQIPTLLTSQESTDNHLLHLADGRKISLKEVADITIGVSEKSSRSFKTDGKDSLILFANPKSGANVKRMAEEILELIRRSEKLFPQGVSYKVLVDPSEFIRNSIANLMKDVVLAGFLAVLVLFLFIGNFRNVATAAIEIPLCMVIAFIVMKFTGMNLNLISLGGLALAAGMNVDASVVVMENIFRHQSIWNKLNPGQTMTLADRSRLISGSVKEVALPIILSIATTLIVFIPLAVTTDLTNAILGDLAKAVIYSHAVSA
ncbi:MAG: efflux RND transporter permease subunit, partial [Bacteroidota bacterium]